MIIDKQISKLVKEIQRLKKIRRTLAISDKEMRKRYEEAIGRKDTGITDELLP